MAYSFNGTSNRLTVTGAPATLGWSSGSLWFYPTDDTLADQMLFGEVNSTGSVSFGIWYGSTGFADKVYFTKTGDAASALSSAAANLNAWNHIFWSFDVYVTPRQYQLSLNGETLVQQDWGSPAGTHTTATCIGFLRTGLSTGSNWFKGYIAELALWNDVLDDVTYPDLFKSMGKRYSPLKIAPGGAITGTGLTNYWQYRGHLNDMIGGRATGGGANAPTWVAEHPPVFYPKGL